MSLSNYARSKAFDFAERVYKQALPASNTNTGSAIRALLLVPFSLIYAAVIQDIDALRVLYLGNFGAISTNDMDLLASNLLQERPAGTRSTATLRVYPETVENFSLSIFPYFQKPNGRAEYSPVSARSFNVSDYFEDEDGDFYVNVPIISTATGPSSIAAPGEITEFRSMPINVNRITNPARTQGGESSSNNAVFFEFLKDAFNSGTYSQVAGVRNGILTGYPEVSEILVVQADDPQMLRDEVWTSDGINPNLQRLGEPFAEHTDLGTVDFDTALDRVYSAAGVFTEDIVGKRIAIDGDIEKFRFVQSYINPNYITVTGDGLVGNATAEIWGEGPRILNKADVYLYTPSVEIQSVVIDNRQFLTLLSTASAGGTTKFYYEVQDGFAYASIPDTGTLVVSEGTETEAVFTVVSSGTDVTGAYLEVDDVVGLSGGAAMSYYDMGEIVAGEDILDLPIMYVLQVDQLDPLSFEVVEEIPRSSAGQYSLPGWYLKNTDPAEVFSTKETKSILLDSKIGSNAFKALNLTGSVTNSSSYFTGTTETTSGDNIITLTASTDLDFTEGREVALSFAPELLQEEADSLTGAVASESGGILTVTGMDIRYDGKLGYRDDIRVVTFPGGDQYAPGSVRLYGDKIERTSGAFPGTITSVDVYIPYVQIPFTEFDDPAEVLPATGGLNELRYVVYTVEGSTFDTAVLYQYNGINWIDITSTVSASILRPASEIESVILSTNGTNTLELLSTDGLPSIRNAAGFFSTGDINVIAESDEGEFNRTPVRVTYATHSLYSDLQSEVDESSSRLLIKDTLIRSFYPTLIDASVNYSGASTSAEVFSRFVELIQEVVSEVENGQRVRLDMSNIIAELDEEGYTDSIDVNFEIRVTNFLADGESEVRYLNPAEETVQTLAFNATTAPAVDRVTLRRVKSTASIPGRGKLFLGGNNPDTQEVLPYEAVIDNGDDTYTFILRNGFDTVYSHTQWESAMVSVRDYDPELEFTEGAIFIPPNNRPYVRQLVIIKT